MNFSRILRHARNSWRLVAACAVVGLLLGALYTLVQSTSYETSAEILVSPNAQLSNTGGAAVSDAYSAGLFTQQRAQSYVELVTSPLVLGPVVAKVGHSGQGPLENSVTALWIAPSTSVVKITVRANSADKAAELANGIAAQLATVVATLERPTDGRPAPVKVSTLRPAGVPGSPISPTPVANALLGLALGLLVGLPLVLARALLDRSVSDSAGLVEATGEPPLGIVGITRAGGLILRDAPQSLVAEAFRKLRTAIRFARPESAAQSLVVTAPQAGAGATTVAANVALAMVEAGRRVVLVDGNLADCGLSRMFGLAESAGLREVLAGDVELEAALAPGGDPALRVLAAGRSATGSGSVLAGPLMVGLLERLEAQADLVIIDAPPVLPFAAAAELSAIADAVLLVGRYGSTKVEEVQQARLTLGQVGTPMLGVVVNAVPGRDPVAVVGAARVQGPAQEPAANPADVLAQRS